MKELDIPIGPPHQVIAVGWAGAGLLGCSLAQEG